MPIPFMGPPILIDQRADFAIAEMPPLFSIWARRWTSCPPSPALRALTMKIVNDANDVIDEITLDGGRRDVDGKALARLRPPPEEVDVVLGGDRTPPRPEGEPGFMLGGGAPGVADIVTATLWSTMTDRFPKIGGSSRKPRP